MQIQLKSHLITTEFSFNQGNLQELRNKVLNKSTLQNIKYPNKMNTADAYICQLKTIISAQTDTASG